MQVRIQKLGNDATYQAAYTTIKNRLSTKGSRPTGNVDPQNNTAEDTITPDQYHKLMKLLLASEKPEWLRDRSIFAHLYASVGRADEGRMIFLADMMSPKPLNSIGEHPACYILAGKRGAFAPIGMVTQEGNFACVLCRPLPSTFAVLCDEGRQDT
jgi:hypothetical protein